MYMTLFMSELLRTSAGVIRITNPKPLQFPERQKGPVERDALFGQKEGAHERALRLHPPPSFAKTSIAYAMVAVGET